MLVTEIDFKISSQILSEMLLEILFLSSSGICLTVCLNLAEITIINTKININIKKNLQHI